MGLHYFAQCSCKFMQIISRKNYQFCAEFLCDFTQNHFTKNYTFCVEYSCSFTHKSSHEKITLFRKSFFHSMMGI